MGSLVITAALLLISIHHAVGLGEKFCGSDNCYKVLG